MANNIPSSAQAGQGSRLAPLSTPRMAATPNTGRRDPASGRPSASARRNNITTTPHARAARRAIDQRRAALFTPGRARRRSVREERETPRDILRNLSRVLAPKSQIVSTSSSPDSPGQKNDSTLASLNEDDESDDDFPIERPRFSLALGLGEDDDDEDEDLKPPRLSGYEEENFTLQSIELPRRATNDYNLNRFDRSSLGSTRFSDYLGPEIRSDNVGIDSGFFPPPAEFDESGEVVMEEPPLIERLDANDARRQTTGGDSVFGAIEIPDAANESTFMIAPAGSPVRDTNTTETAEFEGLENEDDDDDDDHVNEPMDMPDWDSDQGLDDRGLDDRGLDDRGLDDEPNTTNVDRVEERISSGPADLAPRSAATKKKTGKKISRHGIEYPSLPSNVVKRLASTLATTAGNKGKLRPDTLDAIMQATDWFFEQLGDDLSAYAKHAGRKTIDESDMITLMRRQRQTNASTTPFALAQRHLPRELLQQLRMPVPTPSKGPRRKSRHVEVDGEEEVT